MTDLSADLALADSEARESRERERFEAWAQTQSWPHYWHTGGDMAFNARSFDAWQARAALAPAVPQWIPVSERLPDVDKARCFVIAPGASSGDLWPTEWDAENRVFSAAFGGCFKCSEVTHWMYADRLPAPPGASEQAQPAVPPGTKDRRAQPEPAAQTLLDKLEYAMSPEGVRKTWESPMSGFQGSKRPAEKSMPERMQTVLGIVREERAAAPADDPNLIGLLCLIHRDGGHYIQEHGLAKAVADAHEALYLWREAFDAAPSVAPEPTDDVIYQELTDAECDEFRRHYGDFNSMIRLVHSDGHNRHAGRLIQHLGAVFNARFDAALAAHPPRAPLTDEQLSQIMESVNFTFSPTLFARAVEAAHGIRGQG